MYQKINVRALKIWVRYKVEAFIIYGVTTPSEIEPWSSLLMATIPFLKKVSNTNYTVCINAKDDKLRLCRFVNIYDKYIDLFIKVTG